MLELVQRFGMGAGSLEDRRSFIGLTSEDATKLTGLQDWIRQVAPAVATEFYDH